MKIKFKSIQTSMIIYFSGLVLLTVIIFMFFSIRFTKSSLKENSVENSGHLIEQVNLNIENYIDYMETISQFILKNQNMKDYLFEDYDLEVTARMMEEFQTILQVRKDIYNITVLGNNGRYYINRGYNQLNPNAKLEEKEWFQNAKRAGKEIVISSSHVQNLVLGDYKWVVTLTRGIQNPATKRVEGLLIIDLNYDIIKDLCESVSLGKKGYVYIVDQNGEIVYHPQQQLILSGVKQELLHEMLDGKPGTTFTDENGQQKIYTPLHSKKTGWTIVGVVYTSELVKNEQTVKLMYTGIALALIIMASMIAFFMSNNITKPIKQLQLAMKNIQTGNFQPVQIELDGENEIASLNQSFNRMTEHIDELIRKNRREQEEKQKSEMKALQSQINPHFLYNTLDSIIWMIETEDAEDAIEMTSLLAKFFRQSIGNSEIYVTIGQELEYTRNYLLIQQMRYRDKVSFDIQVNQDILDCYIVKLVLQPLVENALYHGLKYKVGQGSIKIIGYRLDGNLVIKVTDDGVGMDQDTLKNLFRPKKRSDHCRGGVGMSNVQERLQLYYGAEYGIQIDSETNVGTTVTITIPYDPSGNYEPEVLNEDA